MQYADPMPFVFALLALSYLIGSIPFGLILTKLAGHGDIRTIGSGNIGATNVLRTGDKKLAALTLLLDAVKGFAPVALVMWLLYPQLLPCDPQDPLACSPTPLAATFFGFILLPLTALLAVTGHMFPVWLKFKGGKGVATSIGAIAALHWPTALITIGLWIPIIFLTRISSLTTLIVSLAVPVLMILFGQTAYVPLVLVLILLIFYKHRENIRRLINHTEPKIGSCADAPHSPDPQ